MRYAKPLLHLICSLCLLLAQLSFAYGSDTVEFGVWVTVFSSSNALTSKSGADELIRFCSEHGIRDIYLQVHRAGEAYYNSEILPAGTFRNIKEAFGEDPVAYLISRAHEKGLRIHLWINVLSIAQNSSADIIQKFGDDALTFDQHGRTPLMTEKDELDNYYIREKQLFLEPGNDRVKEYILEVVRDLVENYPDSDGIHLDYIRYPAAVPFIPGSRFTGHGLSYGYNHANLERFKQATGVNAEELPLSRENALLWDSHRRENVTRLVREISRIVDRNRMTLSGTTVPSVDKAYLVNLQDWQKWLAEDLIDEIFIMNYTDDSRLAGIYARSLAIKGLSHRIVMGLGPYLFTDRPDILEEQLRETLGSGFRKVVFFAYDHILEERTLEKLRAARTASQEESPAAL